MFKCGPDYKDFYKEYLGFFLMTVIFCYTWWIKFCLEHSSPRAPASDLLTSSSFCSSFRCHLLQEALTGSPRYIQLTLLISFPYSVFTSIIAFITLYCNYLLICTSLNLFIKRLASWGQRLNLKYSRDSHGAYKKYLHAFVKLKDGLQNNCPILHESVKVMGDWKTIPWLWFCIAS